MFVSAVSTKTQTEAPPGAVREVAALAYPVVLQTLAETVMHVIDTAMVGKLGTTSLGAVGFSGTWIWTLLVPFAGIASGVQTFVSRHDGAKQHDQTGAWVWHALWVTIPAAIVWSALVALFLPLLFGAIVSDTELRGQAVSYGIARMPGGPAVVIEFALCAFFRGIGDTRTPLKAGLIGVGVNIVMAWLLIFGRWGFPQLGIAGAGIAQSIGSYVIAGVLMYSFLRREVRTRFGTSPVRPMLDALKRFVHISLPIGGQWLLDMTTFAIFTSVVARMGTTEMAASQAMLQLLSLSFTQALAISTAASTLVGRYLGAGDLAAASRSYRSAVLLALGLAAAVALLFVSAPEALLGLFADDSEVLRLARPLLALGAFFQVVDALGIVAAGSLHGAGDTRVPFVMQAGLAWFLRIPAVYFGAVVLGGGVMGAWGGELAYTSVLGGVLMRRFRAGNWQAATI
ncbi:MAG: MATE family efflux transporter [Polyangiales bacterium]